MQRSSKRGRAQRHRSGAFTIGFDARIEQATGRNALLYVEDEFDELYGIFDTFDQPTWERSLRHRPEDNRWIVWQASDVAAVDRVDGGVDLNLMSAECCP